MKKIAIFVSAVIIAGFTMSCNNNDKEIKEEKAEKKEVKAEITDLKSFKEAYEGKELESCDEFKTAANQMFDIYISLLTKAAEGDEDAYRKFQEAEGIMENQLGKEAEKFEEECPEMIEELENKFQAEMDENQDKFDKLAEMMSNEDGVTDDEPENKEPKSGNLEKKAPPKEDPKNTKKPKKSTLEGTKLN